MKTQNWIFNEGYVMLPRKLLTNNYWIALSPIAKVVYLILLGRCNHSEGVYQIGGKPYLVGRGQILTSLAKISKLCNKTSVWQIRNALIVLENSALIVNKSVDGSHRIITILDYDRIQTPSNYKVDSKLPPVGKSEDFGKVDASLSPENDKLPKKDIPTEKTDKHTRKRQASTAKTATNNNVLPKNVDKAPIDDATGEDKETSSHPSGIPKQQKTEELQRKVENKIAVDEPQPKENEPPLTVSPSPLTAELEAVIMNDFVLRNGRSATLQEKDKWIGYWLATHQKPQAVAI